MAVSGFKPFDAGYLALGIPQMDADHSKLIGIANRIGALVSQPNYRESNFAAEMRELRQYTAEHFAREETYMKSIGFPGLKDHVAKHREITQALERFADTGTKGAVVALSLQNFMRVWLFEHIDRHDAEYATYAKAQGRA